MSGIRSLSPWWTGLAVAAAVAGGAAYFVERGGAATDDSQALFLEWARLSAADVRLALEAVFVGVVVLYVVGFVLRSLAYIRGISSGARRVRRLSRRDDGEAVDGDALIEALGPQWLQLPSSSILHHRLDRAAAQEAMPRVLTKPSDLRAFVDHNLRADLYKELPALLVGVGALAVVLAVPVGAATTEPPILLPAFGGAFAFLALAIATAIVMRLATTVVLGVARQQTLLAEAELEDVIGIIAMDQPDLFASVAQEGRGAGERERVAEGLASLVEGAQERLSGLLEMSAAQSRAQTQEAQALLGKLEKAMGDVHRSLLVNQKIAQSIDRLLNQIHTAGTASMIKPRQGPPEERLVQLLKGTGDSSALSRELADLQEEIEALLPQAAEDQSDGRRPS